MVRKIILDLPNEEALKLLDEDINLIIFSNFLLIVIRINSGIIASMFKYRK